MLSSAVSPVTYYTREHRAVETGKSTWGWPSGSRPYSLRLLHGSNVYTLFFYSLPRSNNTLISVMLMESCEPMRRKWTIIVDSFRDLHTYTLYHFPRKGEEWFPVVYWFFAPRTSKETRDVHYSTEENWDYDFFRDLWIPIFKFLFNFFYKNISGQL